MIIVVTVHLRLDECTFFFFFFKKKKKQTGKTDFPTAAGNHLFLCVLLVSAYEDALCFGLTQGTEC